MRREAITFEAVDAALSRANLAPFHAGGKLHFTRREVKRDPSGVIEKICAIWKIVRPILQLLKAVLPKKWKKAIEVFTSLMDTLCP